MRLRESVADHLELRVGVLTKGGYRSDADHDDQGEHDCVLDSGWAIFRCQEPLNLFAKVLPGEVLSNYSML